MNGFQKSVLQAFKGAIKGFQTFPAAIANALAFAIVTLIRIHLDWPQQEAYNFLFNCLHWAFGFGSLFSLAVLTGVQSRLNRPGAFWLANLAGIGAALGVFVGLYFWGGMTPPDSYSRFAVVSGIASARVFAASFISLIAFVYLASYPKEESDFAKALFMTQKAFFVALIYGVVIMAGTSGVAGAFEALLYEEMSEKVYMYLGTLTGFLAFTLFVGYFPDFRQGQKDERRAVVQKQPRFVEILFEYIMVPIMLALTVVLLLWTGRTMLSGMGVSFTQLSGIAAAYTIVGIWLSMMVAHSEFALATFYRRLYPLAALVILGFEAWALVIQLQKSGLKTTEYFFVLVWVVALGGAILLLWRQKEAHPAIAALTCAMAIIAVLPLVGYHSLPVSAQISRLEKILISQGMLAEGRLIPATQPPELAVRESITDAVNFLAYAEGAKLPTWFDSDLREGGSFKSKLGFEQTWTQVEEPFSGEKDAMVTALALSPEAVEIGGYRWAINIQDMIQTMKIQGNGQPSVTVQGNRGAYRVSWLTELKSGSSTLSISLGDRLLLEESMSAYIDRIAKAYPPNQAHPIAAPLKDMSLRLETPEIEALLVFRNVEIRLDIRQDRINYWLDLSAIYMKEKP